MKEFAYVQVNGVKCIIWDVVDAQDDPCSRRKRLKDTVREDVPMLDTKIGKGGHREYCDAIIVTNDVSKWEEYMVDQYSPPTYECIRKPYGRKDSISYQLTWKSKSAIVISTIFYPNKNKLMVQPG